MKQQQYSQFNPQLPSIPRRKNQGGSKATGTSLFPHTKQRPWKIGKQLNGSQSMPVLRPKVKEPRPLRLKAPKKEVRHSELRGHEKKLEELTKGIQKVFPNAIPMVTFVDECSRMLADFGFNRDNSLAVSPERSEPRARRAAIEASQQHHALVVTSSLRTLPLTTTLAIHLTPLPPRS